MKIGEPVTTVPNGHRMPRGESKYGAAYQAAVDAEGAWVPVEFEDSRKAELAFNAAKQYAVRPGQYHGLQVTKRRNVLYFRMPRAGTVHELSATR